jgi:Zinc carboxypeptidase
MPPAPPPNRPAPGTYHFHTYDFAGSAPFQPSAAQPQRSSWRFYSMVQDLIGLRDYGAFRGVPNIALNAIGGRTAGQRRTWVLSFGNQAAPAAAPTVVITGGIHAREWIATEIAYLIAEYLIKNYQAPGAVGLSAEQAQLQNLVDTRSIHIIPMVNPDGNYRTVFGTMANARFWRKNLRSLPNWGPGWKAALAPQGVITPPFANVQYETWPIWVEYDVPDYDPARNIPPGGPGINPNYQNHKLTNLETGVDLNRNMDTAAWAYDCTPRYNNWNPAGPTFFGTRRGGERETSNVQAAMVAVGANITITIDYHSYGGLILYPGETASGVPTPLHVNTGQMLQGLIMNKTRTGGYQLGDPLALTGYDATGTVADRAAQSHAARAFTIELDSSGLGGLQDFALPENEIQPVFEGNIGGALAAIAAPATALDATNYTAQYAWNVATRGNQAP